MTNQANPLDHTPVQHNELLLFEPFAFEQEVGGFVKAEELVKYWCKGKDYDAGAELTLNGRFGAFVFEEIRGYPSPFWGRWVLTTCLYLLFFCCIQSVNNNLNVLVL